jgi:hypothetical protein
MGLWTGSTKRNAVCRHLSNQAHPFYQEWNLLHVCMYQALTLAVCWLIELLEWTPMTC